MNEPTPRFVVNEYTPDPAVVFDRSIGDTYVRYAHRLAARGYVQSTLGGMVIRAEHPDYPDGIAYAKPAGVSLEEMTTEDLVITDIPYGRILHGQAATSVGHQMNREITTSRDRQIFDGHHRHIILILA